MNIKEGVIQITIDDFKQLVKEEVAKQIQRGINPKTIFSDVSLRNSDLEFVNANHKISNIKYHILSCDNRPILPRNLNHIFSEDKKINAIGESTHESDIWSTHIHDTLRKLTLQVYGVKNNRDLKANYYNDARDTYLSFKNVFLNEYEARLYRIEKELENEHTTNF